MLGMKEKSTRHLHRLWTYSKIWDTLEQKFFAAQKGAAFVRKEDVLSFDSGENEMLGNVSKVDCPSEDARFCLPRLA